MIDIAVDGAGGKQPGEMKCPAVLFDPRAGLEECWIFVERTFTNGKKNSWKLLVHDAAAANVKVASFRIPNSTPHLSDINPGSRQGDRWVFPFEPVKVWFSGL